MDAAAQPALKDALIAIPDINVESHTQHPQQQCCVPSSGQKRATVRSPTQCFLLLLLSGRGHRRMSQPIKATESSLA